MKNNLYQHQRINKQPQYEQQKIQCHYDKLCQLIEQKICSKKFIQIYFKDQEFKKYYYNRKKNGQRAV
jgi:hypothetical protein